VADPVVRTGSGLVRGLAGAGAVAFRGIPFAAARRAARRPETCPARHRRRRVPGTTTAMDAPASTQANRNVRPGPERNRH
jgi:hypothetical protein